MEDATDRVRCRGAREEAAAGDRFPEDDAEREDVAPSIERLAVHVLRAHVRELSFEHALAGRAVAVAELGDAEVGDVHAARVREEQVLRRDVAMHEALAPAFARELVRGMEARRGLKEDPRGDARVEALATLIEAAEE